MRHETEIVYKCTEEKSYLGGFVFSLLLVATLISLLGTLMTDFALGQWVYKRTNSATAYGVIGFAALAPQLLFSPLIGTLLDRYARGTLMLIGHAGAGMCTLMLVILYVNDMLTFWSILFLVGISSFFNGLISQSFMLLIPVIIRESQLIKYQGFIQGGMGLIELSVPALAAFLLVSLGLEGIFMADVVSFIAAIGLIMIIVAKINQADGRLVQDVKNRKSISSQLLFGFGYLKNHRHLLALVVFMGGINFSVGIVHVLFTPLVLSFSTVVELGTLLTVAGAGTLIGSTLLTFVVQVDNKRSFLCCGLFIIALLLISSTTVFVNPNYTLWLLMSIVLLLTLSFVMVGSVNQVIWQTSVPTEFQGRVFSVQALISQASLPLAFLVAGPLADYVFEPLLAENGLLSTSVGTLIGVGPGRGIVLLYGLCGLLIITSIGLFYRITNSKTFR